MQGFFIILKFLRHFFHTFSSVYLKGDKIDTIESLKEFDLHIAENYILLEMIVTTQKLRSAIVGKTFYAIPASYSEDLELS